ncbi:MAG: FAD-binding oxidoreductase [Candidatus Nanohaloarchaea archaeon]|nr:FAD-binding oxidoreductase [Candidatus Nanohaloarchaea archaeon]
MGLTATIIDKERVDDQREDFFNDLKKDLENHSDGPAYHYTPRSDQAGIDLDDIDMDLDRLEEKVDGRLDREEPSLLRMRVEPSDDVEFEEGQFIGFQYEREQDDRPLVRQYSIANSYDDYQETGEIELFVKLVEDGRFTPELFDMDEGTTLDMMPPAGHFTMDDNENDRVMISTGTGAAPFVSMVDAMYDVPDADDIQDDHEQDSWLVYGTRWEDDLGYKDEFDAIDEAYDSFHFVPTLSAEPDWDGERDYVQEVVRQRVEDGTFDDDTEYYICGLGEMVGYTAQMLTGNQVDGADEIPDEQTLDDPIDPDNVNFELYS